MEAMLQMSQLVQKTVTNQNELSSETSNSDVYKNICQLLFERKCNVQKQREKKTEENEKKDQSYNV